MAATIDTAIMGMGAAIMVLITAIAAEFNTPAFDGRIASVMQMYIRVLIKLIWLFFQNRL